MAKNLIKAVGNAKTRTLLIITGSILLIGFFVAINSILDEGAKSNERPSRTASVPSGIQSIPGSKTSEKYRSLQVQKNKEEAAAAKKSGRTSVATLVAETNSSAAKTNETGDLNDEFLRNTFEKASTQAKQKSSSDSQYQSFLAAQKQQQQAQEQRLKAQKQEQEVRLQQERAVAEAKVRQQQVETLTTNMQAVMQAANEHWQIPTQAYVAGTWEPPVVESPDALIASAAINATNNDATQVLIKAGSINFAVVDTALNSDEAGPILATLVSGPFKGAKLLGAFTLARESKKVIISFNNLSAKNFDRSVSVNAVAIDPDTARTALATSVNSHYLLRWGSLFASTFVDGYARAVSESGTSVTTTSATGQVEVNRQPLDGKQQFYQGVGEIGRAWAEIAKKNFEKPPTVKVAQGTGVGILFLGDVGPDGLIEPPENTASTTEASNVATVVDAAANLANSAVDAATVGTDR